MLPRPEEGVSSEVLPGRRRVDRVRGVVNAVVSQHHAQQQQKHCYVAAHFGLLVALGRRIHSIRRTEDALCNDIDIMAKAAPFVFLPDIEFVQGKWERGRREGKGRGKVNLVSFPSKSLR